MYTNELYHHGIKGMHWGVRRYQNEDGTLTAAGKRRNRAEDRAARKSAKEQRMWNAKNASQLSDEELVNQIVRLQREKQLKDLTDQAVAPGRKRAKDFLQRNGEQILATAITAATTATVSGLVTKKINDKLDPKESDYDRLKREWDARGRAADEGMPVAPKGWNRVNGKWVKKESN